MHEEGGWLCPVLSLNPTEQNRRVQLCVGRYNPCLYFMVCFLICACEYTVQWKSGTIENIVSCALEQQKCTHATISSAILTANFPTLVPPYFCTSHCAEGSIVFWCKFGGVRRPEEDGDDEEEECVWSASIFLILYPFELDNQGYRKVKTKIKVQVRIK